MVACMKLKVDLWEGGLGYFHNSLVTHGLGGKLKRYVSLHKGEWVKMTKISVM